MATRIPWDKQEVVLLVEAYFWIVNEEIDRIDAVQVISDELRKRAVGFGLPIDAVYRNTNGIKMRFYEIQNIVTNGSSGMKNTSKLFKETVNDYFNHRHRFEILLREAKETVEEKNVRTKQFIEWLREIPENKNDTVVNMLRVFNVLGRKHNVIDEPLQLIDDTDKLKCVRERVIEKNALGIPKKKLYEFRTLFDLYESFCLEAKDADEDSSKEMNSMTLASFQKWMRDDLGLAAGSIRSYASTLNTLSTYMPSICNNEFSIYEVRDIKTVQEIYEKLFSDEGFAELNSKTHNKFRRSLKKYIHFLKEVECGGGYSECDTDTEDNYDDMRQGIKENAYDSVESIIKKADIYGITTEEIASQINRTPWPLRQYLRTMEYAIEVPGDIFIHADNIIDLAENKSILDGILKKQFDRLHGYSNSYLLYEAATITLSMFLNDNGIDSPERCYGIVRYLFEKKEKKYVFGGDRHIWKKNADFPMTNPGVMMNYIRECGGKASKEQCEDFLQKTKLTNIGINHLLAVGSSERVMFYGDDEYVLIDTLFMEEDWIDEFKQSMKKLFDHSAYVILREINQSWFMTLPKLANGLRWNLPLFQDLIKKYLPEYRLITANENQGLETIRAGMVAEDSVIEDFADLVYARMLEDQTVKLPLRISKENLRQKLIEYQMIKGSELIYTMPKALDDPKFAWSTDGDSVLILKQ